VNTIMNLQVSYKSEFQDILCSIELALYHKHDTNPNILKNTSPVMCAGTSSV